MEVLAALWLTHLLLRLLPLTLQLLVVVLLALFLLAFLLLLFLTLCLLRLCLLALVTRELATRGLATRTLVTREVTTGRLVTQGLATRGCVTHGLLTLVIHPQLALGLLLDDLQVLDLLLPSSWTPRLLAAVVAAVARRVARSNGRLGSCGLVHGTVRGIHVLFVDGKSGRAFTWMGWIFRVSAK